MRPADREPDFSQLQRVLEGGRPDRPTLFEFFLNGPLYDELAAGDLAAHGPLPETAGPSKAADAGAAKAGAAGDASRAADADAAPSRTLPEGSERLVRAFRAAGYDYATTRSSDFAFPKDRSHKLKTISQNEGSLVWDRESFRAYPWPDPDAADYGLVDEAAAHLSPRMKLIVHGPGGVLENVTDIVSYERLCLMLVEDPGLAKEVFDAVGSRLVRYYELSGRHEGIGAMISNDDWGFKTQTMISPAMMREYVFPWHKRIVDTIHAAGKPAILHSCGNLNEVMDDVIDHLGYDAKHSYEDAIVSVEDAYERWGDRIAILGGIDVDFMCSSSPQEVCDRSRRMLERAEERGGYALGSGNSIPEYVPNESYFAMTRAAWE